MSAASGEPLGIRDLVDYFRSGETAPADFRVGTEHEKIGIYTDSGERVPYEGERGIGALLARVADADGWEPVREGPNTIALQKENASITLEPGGQMELSGAPLRSAFETCAEFNSHVDLLNGLSEDFGIAWLGLGGDPLHDVPEIPVVPKQRYAIMRRYLPTRGSQALQMMHATATVQANFDYRDEADMVSKLRTAMGCSPIVSAMFANSSLSQGRANGFASRRVEIWRHTDPDRCGILPFVFDPGFGYRAYAEWALDVPMFFVAHEHHYREAGGLTFRRFSRSGFAGRPASLEDWDLHLTTLFPEVRLKRYIEVRGADAVPRGLTCALPALWKGIFYDPGALEAAWALVADWEMPDRQAALPEVARRGLAARIAGRPVLELAHELCRIAAEGLRRIAEHEAGGAEERSFLDPLFEQVELGKSPGQVVQERWDGEWRQSLARLIEYVRY